MVKEALLTKRRKLKIKIVATKLAHASTVSALDRSIVRWVGHTEGFLNALDVNHN